MALRYQEYQQLNLSAISNEILQKILTKAFAGGVCHSDAYIELFNKMFINGLYDTIWSNFTMMRNDCHLFNEQIFTRLNYNIKYTNNINIKYEPSPEDIKGFLTLNRLNELIQNY